MASFSNGVNSFSMQCRSQIKERKLKKVTEVDPDPHVSSENALLAERSFLSETEESITNGYCSEWTEKVPNQSLSFQGFRSGVGNISYRGRSSL